MASDQNETTCSGESENQDNDADYNDYAGEGLSHDRVTYLENLDAYPSTSTNFIQNQVISEEPRNIQQSLNQEEIQPRQSPSYQSPSGLGIVNFKKLHFWRQLSLPASLGISPASLTQTNQLSEGLSHKSNPFQANLDAYPSTSINFLQNQVVSDEPRNIQQNVNQEQIEPSQSPGNQSPNVYGTVPIQELSLREKRMDSALGILAAFTQAYQRRRHDGVINSVELDLLQITQHNISSNKDNGPQSVHESNAAPLQSGMTQSPQSIQTSSLSEDDTPYFSPLTSDLTLEDRWFISEEYVNLTPGDPDNSNEKSNTYLLNLLIKNMGYSTILTIIQKYYEIVGRRVEDDGYCEYFVESEQNQGKEEDLSVCVRNRDIVLLLDYENVRIFFEREDNLKCIKEFFEEVQKQKIELLIWICINALHFTESQGTFFNELRKNAKTLVSRTLGIADNAADNGIFIILINLHRRVTPSGEFFVFSGDKVFNKLNGCPLFGGRNLQVINSAEALPPCKVQPVETVISNVDLYQHISNTFKDLERTVYILDSSTRSLELLNNLTKGDVDSSWIIIVRSEKKKPPFVPFSPVENLKRLKVLKKANGHIKEAAEIIQCYEGQAPIMIMGLIVYMLERLGQSAVIHIFTGNETLFVSFGQQFKKGPKKLRFNYETLSPHKKQKQKNKTKQNKKQKKQENKLNIFVSYALIFFLLVVVFLVFVCMNRFANAM